MTALTNQIREAIQDDLILHRFKDEAKAIHAAYADFAFKVYCGTYDEKTRDQIDSLPDGWLPSGESITVRFGYGGHRLYFGGAQLSRCPSAMRTHPQASMRLKNCDVNWFVEYGARSEIAEEHAALEAKKDDFLAQIGSAKAAIQQALKVSTIEKLIREWPEVQPFAQRYIATPTAARLPIIPVDKLNAELGLPVPEAAA